MSSVLLQLRSFWRGGNSPLSQELLNSVRRAKSELRRTTGSEPKKLMDVAEYRSFPFGQEQEMRLNSWRSIIHIKLEQYLIYKSSNGLQQHTYSMWSEQVALAKLLGNIYDGFGATFFVVSEVYTHTHTYHTDLFCWCTLNVRQHFVLCFLLTVKPDSDTHRPWGRSISGRDQKDTSPFPPPAFLPASAVRSRTSVGNRAKERGKREKRVKRPENLPFYTHTGLDL